MPRSLIMLKNKIQVSLKKSLGQHFLKDKNICQKIVNALDIEAHDRIIEIGPGAGALTSIIEKYDKKSLVLLEKDYHWSRERQNKASHNTQSILIDALTFPWHKIDQDYTCKIIGNLPYNVASPLMWDIFSQARGMLKAVFMVQKEVGQRLIAMPNTKNYGALSVWIQSFVKPQLLFYVPAQAFMPPPRVESAVLTFTPLAQNQLPYNAHALGNLIKMCFQQRRKQLSSIFKNNKLEKEIEQLQKLGIDPMRRPETLSIAEFQKISQRMLDLILKK